MTMALGFQPGKRLRRLAALCQTAQTAPVPAERFS